MMRPRRCPSSARLISPSMLLRVFWIIEFDITDLKPLFAQLLGKMAHGGKQEGELLRMMFDISGLLHDFAQKHNVRWFVLVSAEMECDS